MRRLLNGFSKDGPMVEDLSQTGKSLCNKCRNMAAFIC